MHFRYHASEQVLARFVAILPKAECKVPNPSSRVRATVHWTVAFDSSNLSGSVSPKRKSTPFGVLFFLEVLARFELANNGFADRGLTTWLRYHMK